MNPWRYHRIAGAPARRGVRALAVVTAAAWLSAMAAPGVVAQTLTNPNPPPKSSATPPAAAKPARVGRTKSCSDYGDGFVYVPASDTCVKVGGYLRFDAGVNH
jgi:hypothetical protein